MKQGKALLLTAFVSLPFLLALYMTAVSPRPYYLMETDLEAGYYYWTALIFHGERPQGVSHPGTPIHLLGSFILRLFGSEFRLVESTQQVLNVLYLLIGALTSVSLWLFTKYMLDGIPIGWLLLALGIVIAWPPSLTFTNYFCSDSFVIAWGLPTVTLFWSSLRDKTFRRPKALLCGVGIGLCTATKMTFLPLAGAITFGYAVNQIVKHSGTQSRWQSVTNVLVVPLTAMVTFAVLTLPVWHSLPDLLWLLRVHTAGRRPNLELFVDSFNVLSQVAWPLTLIFLTAPVAFIWLALQLYSYERADPGNSRIDFDWISACLFLAIMVGYFLSLMGTPPSERFHDTGITLRWLSPTVLVFPFLLVFCFKACEKLYATWWIQHYKLQVLFCVLAVVVVGVSISTHFAHRQGWIVETRARAEEGAQALNQLAGADARVAFWDGSPGTTFGPASFHFWGNSRYAAGYFSDELLSAFPRHSHFYLRELTKQRWEKLALVDRKDSGGALRQTIKSLLTRGGQVWTNWFPRPEYTMRTRELVSGENKSIEVSSILVLDQEETERVGIHNILAAVRERFGLEKVRVMSIAGNNFYVLGR